MIYWLKRHPACAMMIAGFATFGAGAQAVIYASELRASAGPVSPGITDTIAAMIGPDPITNAGAMLALIGLGLFGYGGARWAITDLIN